LCCFSSVEFSDVHFFFILNARRELSVCFESMKQDVTVRWKEKYISLDLFYLDECRFFSCIRYNSFRKSFNSIFVQLVFFYSTYRLNSSFLMLAELFFTFPPTSPKRLLFYAMLTSLYIRLVHSGLKHK
jgi:hypothetical protein